MSSIDQFIATNKDQWNRLYSRRTDDSVAKTESELRSVPGTEETIAPFLQDYFAQLPEGMELLEIGCGPGINLVELAKTHRCTGLDISKVALESAGQLASERGVEVRLVEGGFYRLPFVAARFDCLVASFCLQFNTWSSAQMVWSEIARVLRPGGYFVFKVRSTYRDIPLSAERIEDRGITFVSYENHEHGMTYHHFSEGEIEELMERNGLEKIDLHEHKDERADEQQGKRGWWTGLYRKA
ncbi:class I SAM-dependent methyltransferase [Paenibacillus oleatilyticus]|uniref:Class I SAM-dependent methyltransferase n=1 Tax=Paenibacillus oleatilyticus TaxID=2594886 RepID=A0ABV4V0Q2_9BACL